MSYILYICVAVPVLLMLLPIDKKSRKVIIALLVGMSSCLFISEVNGLLLHITNTTTNYLTTNLTPITEELAKAFPLVFFAAVISDDKKTLFTIAFGIGVGFALLENMIILIQHISTVNLVFAIIRGFSSGLMHSICTIMYSYSVSYIHTKKKLFICDTLCTINLAIVYHSIFNMLVEAESGVANYIGYFLPLVSYVVFNLFFFVGSNRMKHEKEKTKEENEDTDQ